MSNKVYDVLKYVALIGLPALSALYGTLASIWGLPYGEQITATVGAVTVALGALLQIKSAQYRKKNSADTETVSE